MVEKITIEIVKDGLRHTIQPFVNYNPIANCNDDDYANNVASAVVEMIKQCNIDKDYAAEMITEKLKWR